VADLLPLSVFGPALVSGLGQDCQTRPSVPAAGCFPRTA